MTEGRFDGGAFVLGPVYGPQTLVAHATRLAATRLAAPDDHGRSFGSNRKWPTSASGSGAAPVGSDKRRALAERFRRANREGTGLLLKPSEWRAELASP